MPNQLCTAKISPALAQQPPEIGSQPNHHAPSQRAKKNTGFSKITDIEVDLIQEPLVLATTYDEFLSGKLVVLPHNQIMEPEVRPVTTGDPAVPAAWSSPEPEDQTHPEYSIGSTLFDWVLEGPEQGLWASVRASSERPGAALPVWVCQPYTVEALVMDGRASDYGVHVSWKCAEGRRHEMTISREALVGDANKVFKAMIKEGFKMNLLSGGGRLLASYLGGVETPVRGRTTRTLGWCDGAFVFPDETIGTTASGRKVYLNGKGDDRLTTSGTLGEWQSEIGVHAVGNSRLSLGMAMPFVGPVLRLVGADSFGVHNQSKSSRGKSTIGEVAGSVTGGPKYISTWKATAAGLEATLANHNDSVLVLDEILQAEPRHVAEVEYLIAGDTGKIRMNKMEALTWKTAVLSNGEVTPEARIRSAGLRPTAGGDVRMMVVPMLENGFERFDPFSSREAFALHLLEAKTKYYGTPIRAFISHLVNLEPKARIELVEWLKTTSREWAASAVPDDADAQVKRGARQFGLIYAAGALAQKIGVLPWPEGNIDWAVRVCLDAWIGTRGGTNSKEDQAGIQNVLAFIETYGDSRFVQEGDGVVDDRDLHEPVGFKKSNGMADLGEASVDWLLTAEGFKEACGGEDIRATAKALLRAGFLAADPGRNQKNHRIPGGRGTINVYWVKGSAVHAHREKMSGE